jgi:hypothetical protein
MKLVILLALFVVLSAVNAENKKEASKKSLQIGIKKKVENCPITSRKGDSLSM